MESNEDMLKRYAKLNVCMACLKGAEQNMVLSDTDEYEAEEDGALQHLDEVESSVRYAIDEMEEKICEGMGVMLTPGTTGWAIDILQHGGRVARKGWNGKGMYLELKNPSDLSDMSQPYVFMRTAQGDLVPWLCSQTDFLATDWKEVD